MDKFFDLISNQRTSHVLTDPAGAGLGSAESPTVKAHLGLCTPPAFTEYTPNRRDVPRHDASVPLAQSKPPHCASPSSPGDEDSNCFNSQQGDSRLASRSRMNNLSNVFGTGNKSEAPSDSFDGQGELIYPGQDNLPPVELRIAKTPTRQDVSGPTGELTQESRLSSHDASASPEQKGNRCTPGRASPDDPARDSGDSQPICLTVSSEDTAPPTMTFPMNCESRLSMTLCGEVITFDLKNLDTDPRVITELLQASKSERANYMVVAAFYRRIGNPQSAKAVLLSMIDEFTKRGAARKVLKPAYLMLSGCETDLARIAQESNKDPSVAAGNEEAAKAWLQKVFGSTEAPPMEKGTPRGPAKCPLPTRPRALSNPRTASPFNVEKHKLEREIQILRARTTNQAAQISELRTSKRKLEEDVVYERNLRRKVQRELENIVKERDAARKIEKFALTQVKKEVASRRDAEARLEILLNKENI